MTVGVGVVFQKPLGGCFAVCLSLRQEEYAQSMCFRCSSLDCTLFGGTELGLGCRSLRSVASLATPDFCSAVNSQCIQGPGDVSAFCM